MARIRFGYMTNKSYFRLIFALFLAMQTLSLLMNMAVCTFLRGWLAEDAKSYNRSVVDSLESSLESMMTELTRLGRSTAKIASQANKLHSWDTFTHEDYVQIRSLAQDFGSVMSIKEAVGSWLYYNQDKNFVIANGDIYRADIYFSKFFPYSQLSQSYFDAMIQDTSQQLIGLETQKEWTVEGKEIARQVVPFAISYKDLSGQKALLVLNIRVQYLYDMTLSYRSSEKMGLLIADGQQRPVVSWGIFHDREQEVLQVVLSGEGSPASLMESRLDGKQLVFLVSKSAFLNWGIYIAYQKDEFYRKSDILFWSLTVFNLLVTGFGVGLSYLMSRRLFSPIHNLLHILYPQPPENRYNELQLISNRFEQMRQDNQSLADDLQQMLPEVKNAYLKNLLGQPDFLSDRRNRAFFVDRLQLSIQGPFLLCGLLVRYKKEFLEELTVQDRKQQKGNVQEFLIKLVENFCSRMEFVRLTPEQDVFLLELENGLSRDYTKTQLEQIVLLFRYDQENIRLHFLLGETAAGADALYEVNRRLWAQGMNRILLEGDSGVVDLSSAGEEISPSPERKGEKLWNLLQGQETGAFRPLLYELAGKGAQNHMSMAQAAEFYRWTVSRCMDFMQNYNLDTDALRPFLNYDAAEAFSLDELCSRALNAMETAHFLFRKKDITCYDAYTRFMSERYTDCTLSSEMAADYFHTSASSFSRSFKEEMGVTFPKYLTALRIRKARELLLVTSLRIDEVAAMVGISNRVTFNRLFKQSEGMSPGQFRELNQNVGSRRPEADQQ
ncbi:MAG: helix-turn-helix transcriptional regulator [Provencibacterium sp.]|nr:helix-turn-helix transcriptional regulator [Provencibacterium sp.]